jgi:hypothetical protein
MANNTGIKYGGRIKGTANKATARLREAFTDLLEGNMGRLKELLLVYGLHHDIKLRPIFMFKNTVILYPKFENVFVSYGIRNHILMQAAAK